MTSDALTKLRGILETLDLDEATHQAVFEALEEVGEYQTGLENEVADKYGLWNSLAHDIRTPLSTVIGLPELLKAQILGPLNEEQLKRLDRIMYSGRGLLILTNNLIDLAKIKTNTLKLNPQQVDIKEFLNKFTENISNNNVELSVDYDLSVETIVIDKLYLSQLLYGLILRSNYPIQQKQVKLIVTNQSNVGLRFSIIEKSSREDDELPHILENLQQKTFNFMEIYGYPGLSVVVAYYLCELMGGTLNCEIIGTDEVQFTVELPQTETS